MPDYIERLTACGINLADAFDIYDDFLSDDDESGLESYVLAVETDYLRRLEYVD